MRLTKLDLEEFRCYHRATLDLPCAGLRLYGRNASGKTSLLEAIYLLATMRSPRASYERETINWESAREYGLPPYARVRGWIRRDHEPHDIEAVLTADETRGNVVRKRVKLDGRSRRALDVVGTLKVVLFEPEDLDLVLGSPSIRRRYLDISLSQIDRTYLHALSRYGRILEQRNSLLKDLWTRADREGRVAGEELAYWDGELVTQGSYLVAARIRYVRGLGQRAADAFRGLLNDDGELALRYNTTLALPEPQSERLPDVSMPDAQALVARTFEADLLRTRSDELRRGVTLTGPHRDDFTILVGGRELAAYGSRGQQRLAVIATKLAELGQVLALTDEHPVLMLDDVLSELDPLHRERLLTTLGDARCQIIVTATDRDLLDRPSLAPLPLVEVRAGELFPEGSPG